MEKKMLTDVEIIAALAETPLAIVIGALRTGTFAPAPKKPVGKKETAIGRLSPFEKAVYTVRNAASESLKAIAKANDRMIEKSLGKEEVVDLAKIAKNKRMAEPYAETSKALDALLLASTKQRLGAPALCKKIGIREGYKIVQNPSSSSIEELNVRGLALSLLNELEELAGLSLLNELEELNSGHHCKTCPDDKYAACNLLIKKPRK